MRDMKVMRPCPSARLAAVVLAILILTRLIPAFAGQTFLAGGPTPHDSCQAPEPYRDRLARDLEQTIARVQPLLLRYGYPAVFLAILVEGVGLLAPGQSFLMAAAFAAAQGTLSIVWVLFWAFSGAVAGNSLGYLLGRLGGRPLLHRFKVNEERLSRLEDYFTRRGKWLVLIARFFDGLRQLNGIVAGLLKMPWRLFIILNMLGAALWTGVWGLGVYFLDKEMASWHFTLRQAEPWVAAACLLAFLALLVYLLGPGRKKHLGGEPRT
jgi:membrane protein DedA with SNARE-associated domain